MFTGHGVSVTPPDTISGAAIVMGGRASNASTRRRRAAISAACASTSACSSRFFTFSPSPLGTTPPARSTSSRGSHRRWPHPSLAALSRGAGVAPAAVCSRPDSGDLASGHLSETRRRCPPAHGYNDPPWYAPCGSRGGYCSNWLAAASGLHRAPASRGVAILTVSASLPLSHHRRSGYESGVPWRRAVLFSGPAMSACLPMPQPAGNCSL